MKRKTKAMRSWLHQTLNTPTDNCRMWPFGVSGAGYGRTTVDGRQVEIHRHVCTIVHGPPKPGMVAAHRCGNKRCANPRHIRWATRSENEIDKLQHGHAGTLTERMVGDARAIHARGEVTITALAKQYNVARETMGDAIRGATWRHLPIPKRKTL